MGVTRSSLAMGWTWPGRATSRARIRSNLAAARTGSGAGMSRAANQANQGSAIRPGARLAPSWVWQLLQSPVGGDADIARRLPPAVTATWIGAGSAASEKKLPAALTDSLVTAPVASVTSTVAVVAPKHSSGSWPVG